MKLPVEDSPGCVLERRKSLEGSSFLSSVLNLIINILGVGVLLSAWTFLQASVIPAIVFLTVICVLNGFAFLLLGKCCDVTQTFSYLHMGRIVFGDFGGKCIQAVMLVHTFFSCVQYLVFIGDLLPLAMSNHVNADSVITNDQLRIGALIFLTVFILAPLSLLRKLDALKYTSISAMCGICYIIFIVFFTYSKNQTPVEVRLFDVQPSLIGALPVFSLSFCAHFNGPEYYKELSNRSLPKFGAVAATALGVCLLINIGIGYFGLATFGNQTQSILLDNYSSDIAWRVVPDYWVEMAQWVFSVIVAFTFPLMFHAFKRSVFSLVLTCWIHESDQGKMASLFFLVVMCFIAIVWKDIVAVTSYLGAITGSLIVYIIPSSLFLRMCARMKHGQFVDAYTPLSPELGLEKRKPEIPRSWLCMSWLLFCWGWTLMLLGVSYQVCQQAGWLKLVAPGTTTGSTGSNS